MLQLSCRARSKYYNVDMSKFHKKVLIVDDDSLLIDALELTFQNSDYDTYVLRDGNQVKSVVEKWKPDVVLLDIMLPGKGGVEIIKEISATYKDFCDKVIVMTTLQDSQYLAEALELGVKNYIQKTTSNPKHVFEMAEKILNK